MEKKSFDVFKLPEEHIAQLSEDQYAYATLKIKGDAAGVTIPYTWTCLELKNFIKEHYPAEFNLETMKIVYSGMNLDPMESMDCLRK